MRDLVRLEYGPWDHRPDLRAAFHDGYGRTPTALETNVLHCMVALDALSGVAWGTHSGATKSSPEPTAPCTASAATLVSNSS